MSDSNSTPPSHSLQSSSHTLADSCSTAWSRLIDSTRIPIQAGLHVLSGTSARHPRKTILGVTLLSLALIVCGIATNFHVETDGDLLWTPQDSRTIAHMRWIDDESGFSRLPRYFFLQFHYDGNNLLDNNPDDTVRGVFQAVNAIQAVEGYDALCAQWEVGSCRVAGIVDFFNESLAVYDQTTSDDASIVAALSSSTFPDGRTASDYQLYGSPVRNADNVLTQVLSTSARIDLPEADDDDDDAAMVFEEKALKVIEDMNEAWKQDGTPLRMERFADRSFDDEFGRAILSDIPLVPIVFVIMSIFTAVIFFRKHRVFSRSLLGFGAVISVFLSLMSGFGLLFCCGVPFSSMTQILPFVIFGIGLDDAFIINGSYERTDSSKTPEERIAETIDDVGLSITLTTFTSIMAFGLGCLSSIPAVYWLCLYAFPTIAFVLLYQVTFFVAVTVLDEKRIADRRMDCCTCIRVRNIEEEDSVNGSDVEHFADRLMGWYAEKLLQPWVKVIVLLGFAALAAGAVYSTTLLRQEFKFTDVLPDDSYITDYFDVLDLYTDRSSLSPYIYFRDVDQSDPEIQAQMVQYVDELVAMKSVVVGPEYFWLTDFQAFVANGETTATDFSTQMDDFLSVPANAELYAHDLYRNEDGIVVQSRARIYMDNIDIDVVREQIDALEDQRSVSARQPINQGKDDWSFFTFEPTYNIWQFYTTSARELALTTILGVISVTGVGLLMIPHWSAALFVLPLICVLYIDLLGFMQWAGLSINVVSYVTLVMSIGLLVDFIMHVLLRYYECLGNRREKTVETLKTMGASVMIGGMSTFLGTLPLAFSSSEIFTTVFFAFLGLVLMGVSHGLILLPVVLSMIGPEVCILAEKEETTTMKQQQQQPKGLSTGSGEISDEVKEEEELEEVAV